MRAAADVNKKIHGLIKLLSGVQAGAFEMHEKVRRGGERPVRNFRKLARASALPQSLFSSIFPSAVCFIQLAKEHVGGPCVRHGSTTSELSFSAWLADDAR